MCNQHIGCFYLQPSNWHRDSPILKIRVNGASTICGLVVPYLESDLVAVMRNLDIGGIYRENR